MANQRELVEVPTRPRGANKVYYVEEDDDDDDIPYANTYPARQNRPVQVVERDAYRNEPQYVYNEVPTQRAKRPVSATMYQQDNRLVPYNRTEPKQKTLVIKDEYGREISRIVSSKKRPNSIHLSEVPPPMQNNNNQYNYAQPNNEIAIQPMQTMAIQPYAVPAVHAIPSVQAVTPMVAPAPMTSPVILQPTNEYIAEPYDTYSSYVPESATTQVYVKATGRNKVYDVNHDDYGRASVQKKAPLKRREEKPIDCCSFCDRPRTDVCYCCWQRCSCPIWWTLVIALIVLLALAGAGAVIGLYAGGIITG